MFDSSDITEAPLAPARAVAKPAITEVIDLETGEILDSSEFITGFLYQALVEKRVEIASRMADERPLFCCSLCHVPVYLVSRAEEHVFFFRHRHEDGSCPAETRSPLSEDEINARKYHGLRESEPHKQLKALLLRSLDADPMFSDTQTEKHWKSTTREGAYRRPDVQADHGSGRMAFEVQLSTTFLKVVVGRRLFYRDEGGMLLWIFAGFDPAYRLMTTDDLLFPNNSNAFVIDEETVRISKEQKQFHLRCHYRRAIREGDKLADCWEEAIVPFEALVQDRESQRIFYHDYAAGEADVLAAIAVDAAAAEEQRSIDAAAAAEKREAEAAKRQAAQDRADRRDLYGFWLTNADSYIDTPENNTVWFDIRRRFGTRWLTLPPFPDTISEARTMLNALYSVQWGAPVGWRFKKLIEVAHLIAERHPRHLLAFGYAVESFDQWSLLRQQDKGRWQARQTEIRAALRRHDPEYMPDAGLLPLMEFLFPDVGARVRAYLDRASAGPDLS